METFVSKASGATLGYIAANLPGAYIGYKMAPVRRRRMSTLAIMRSMKRKARSYPQSQGRYVKKRRQTNNITTKQYDVTTQYSKKRMPYKKRKSWAKFSRRVTAVGLKNASLKTVIFNDKIVSTSNPNYQQVFAFPLYGVNGTNVTNSTLGYNDLFKIFQNEPAVTKLSPSNAPANGCLNFGSAVLDVTLRNLSEIDAEVDVYYGYHWKDTSLKNPANGNDTRNLIEDLNVGGQNQPIAVGNTTLNLGERGCTPFDISYGIAASGFKVLKKQKLLMEPGKSVFIQHRDPGNRRVDWININKGGYAKKRLTYEVLVIHKPAVTNNDSAVSVIAAGVTRKYGYTIMDWNQDENAKL